MGVSKNNGTPILIGFSIINHPFWGTPISPYWPVLAFEGSGKRRVKFVEADRQGNLTDKKPVGLHGVHIIWGFS